jgi:hypothetical protein
LRQLDDFSCDNFGQWVSAIYQTEFSTRLPCRLT